MESTPIIVTYAPLILAGVSALGFAATIGVLIISRVFRLGKFFAEFTTLQETVSSLQETVPSQETITTLQEIISSLQETVPSQGTVTTLQETVSSLQKTVSTSQETVSSNQIKLEQAIADNRAETADNRSEIASLRAEVNELRDSTARIENKIEAGLQELRGYFVAHLEYHAGYAADDD